MRTTNSPDDFLFRQNRYPNNTNDSPGRRRRKEKAKQSKAKQSKRMKRKSEEGEGDEAAGEAGKDAAAHESQRPGKPQRRFFRQRAHANPYSFNSAFEPPVSPDDVNWAEIYPDSNGASVGGRAAAVGPTIVDAGCGFGGLTVALAKAYPEDRVFGMEIREKVCEYVRRRILSLREEHPGMYKNAAVVRTNAMRYMPNFIRKGSLRLLIFAFPDPQFKERKKEAQNHHTRAAIRVCLHAARWRIAVYDH